MLDLLLQAGIYFKKYTVDMYKNYFSSSIDSGDLHKSCFIFVLTTVWHENFTVVKFYGSPLSHLDEKLFGF